MSSFANFDLPKPIQSALAAMQYSTPTPIQEQAIPVALSGKDLIGLAQTGTGKTAAFGIPMLVSLINNPNKSASALILVPTRELALQIQEVLKQLTHFMPEFQSVAMIGGMSMYNQVKVLGRRPRLLIATPGRLLDHLAQRTVTLNNVTTLVLDEADRMLDIGFEPQLRRILKYVPQQRQTMLFSATFPKSIEKLASQYLKNPTRVSVGAIVKPIEKIQQAFIQTTVKDKNAVLIKELDTRDGSVLIFARTKHRTDRLARFLAQEGFSADRIHGDRTQGQRNRALDAFRQQKIRILVATDIASRGIDVPHIAHVINYDLPQVPEDYIHRIGRTARAGAEGSSLCLLTPEDKKQWRDLSRHLSSFKTMPAPRLQ